MNLFNHRKHLLSVTLCFYIVSLLFSVQSSFAENMQDLTITDQVEEIFTSLVDVNGHGVNDKDVVATVNGKNITLSAILTVYTAGTFATNMNVPQSVDAVRDDFSIILQELITYELLRQELEARKIFVTDIDIQCAEQEVRAPFLMRDDLERAKRLQAMKAFSGLESEKQLEIQDIENIDTFSESLLERGLTVEQWRVMLVRQLYKQTFIDQVLEPTIHIAPDEIEAAYRAHSELISFDKHVQYQLFNVVSDGVAEQIMHAIQDDESTQLMDVSGYIVEDFLMPYDRLPDAWMKVVIRAEEAFKKNTEKRQYAEIIDRNNERKVLCVQEILPARTLTLGEAYVRLERLLMEQKLAVAFGQWLEYAWQAADIRLASQLSLINCHDDERKSSQESILK